MGSEGDDDKPMRCGRRYPRSAPASLRAGAAQLASGLAQSVGLPRKLPTALAWVVLLQVVMLILLVHIARNLVWVDGHVIKSVNGRLRTLAEEVRDLEDLVFEASSAVEREVIHDGYKLMQGLSAVFVTLLRNSREAFEAEIPFIERTGGSFAQYKVLCLEEGSSDGTREMLVNWSRSNPGVLVRESGVPGEAAVAKGQMATTRYVRMARLRNAYLRMLRAEAFFGADVLIVVDSDLNLGWDVDGIAHSFGLLSRGQAERLERPEGLRASTSKPAGFLFQRESGDADYEVLSPRIAEVFHRGANMPYWDYARRRGLSWTAVCSNGRVRDDFNRVYDTIAFRNAYFTKHNFRHHQRVTHSPMGPPEFVESCFGGLAIYNVSSIGDCEYAGTDCEHVPFHECLARRGGRMLFNPRQVVEYSA